MIKLLGIVVFVFALFAPAQFASAHVVIQDETSQKGALLHIIPDDDPVAGETASLYFDIQGVSLEVDDAVTLSIKNDTGEAVSVPVTINETLATAEYVFPVQGVYTLTYGVMDGEDEYVFNQTQRVSRGEKASALNEQTHSWAQGLLIGAGVGLVVLAIVAFNRRKAIAKYSSF